MTDQKPPLPAELQGRIDEIVEASGLSPSEAKELRADLTAHALDGLAHGRPPGELARRLGEPTEVAAVLNATPPPPIRRPDTEAKEGWLEAFVADSRLAVRTIRRTPGLALAAMVVLGVGIAAATVAFTVVNEIFLRPLPVQDQGRLVDVWATEPGGNSFSGFGWQDVLAYREATASGGPLADLAAFAGLRMSLGEGPGRRPVVGQLVTRDYFPMLGVSAELGSSELEEDRGFGGPRTVVLSHALWRDAMAADPEILGRTIVLQGETMTVIGVAEEGFRGHFIGFPVDLWLPVTTADLVMASFDPNDRSRMPFEMIGRMADGALVMEVERFLGDVARTLEARHPETHRGHGLGASATTGVDHSLRPVVMTFVAAMTFLAALVLMVACLNVGSLLLVRTLAREGELAVRLALGARRTRLARQLLTEALLFSALGLLVGVTLSRVLSIQLDGLFRSLAPGLGLGFPFDVRVLLLSAGAATVAALVVGSASAWHALRRISPDALRRRPGASAGSKARAVLVSAQVAVSVALVITTGLFLRALVQGSTVDPGFAADEVASFTIAGDGPLDPPRLDALMGDLRGLPGVQEASLASGPPTGVARTPAAVKVPGVEPPPDEEAWAVDARRVGPRYLATVGTTLRRGRDIGEADVQSGPPVAIVNQAFVDRFWPATDPLGQSLEVDGRVASVVGIADDSRTLVQDETPDPFVYVSVDPGGMGALVITVRSRSLEELTEPVRSVVAQHVPGAPPPTLAPARDALDAGLLAHRLGVAFVGGLGGAALLLAVVGLYGLIQYSVRRDRHELAVRLALGGTRGAVLGSVLRKGLLLIVVGTLSGGLLAAAGSPALSGFLMGVSPRDPLTYGAVIVLFSGVALLACVVPARHAISIPPAAVLRGDS